MEQLLKITDISQLSYMQTMQLYSRDLQEDAAAHYPSLTGQEALFASEQAFYSYLKDVFFQTPGACMYAWSVDGVLRSCLRIEPYENAFLLCGITTDPDYLRRGFGEKLLRGVSALYAGPLYSHVEKSNYASLQLHLKCDFERRFEWARMLNGEMLHNFCTFVHEK